MRQARTRNETTESTETMSENTPATTGTRESRRGFGGYNKLNQTTFRVEDDSEVIIFLEPENFTYALRHWVKYIGEDGKQATRVEYCLEDDCPLCDIGDKPKPVAFFNVVDVTSPGKVLVWEASADPTGAIQKEFNKLAKRGQTLSDDGIYWVISKEKGRNGFYTFSVDKITEDEMAIEWKSLRPITSAQREALRHRMYDDTYVQFKERQEIADFVDTLG